METQEQETKLEQKLPTNKLSIPMAIIVAGVVIAGAIYFSSIKSPNTTDPTAIASLLDKIRPVSKTDHIRGDINAPIKIVEYSDIECPFCKKFYATMQQINDEYGASGKVAWIYRHSPIDSLHPNARKDAEATECANELGGNNKFWEYLDRLHEIMPEQGQLDPKELPKVAEYIGLNVTDFNTCLSSGKYAELIQKDVQNASDTGSRGTPWSIVLLENGQKFSIEGAQPYEMIKQNIDTSLK
ncbi:MAG: thioredoxin domain-containing protein [Candidatus Paceibacterota bacterium]|jgi:protein-disulfide isomerase